MAEIKEVKSSDLRKNYELKSVIAHLATINKINIIFFLASAKLFISDLNMSKNLYKKRSGVLLIYITVINKFFCKNNARKKSINSVFCNDDMSTTFTLSMVKKAFLALQCCYIVQSGNKVPAPGRMLMYSFFRETPDLYSTSISCFWRTLGPLRLRKQLPAATSYR